MQIAFSDSTALIVIGGLLLLLLLPGVVEGISQLFGRQVSTQKWPAITKVVIGVLGASLLLVGMISLAPKLGIAPTTAAPMPTTSQATNTYSLSLPTSTHFPTGPSEANWVVPLLYEFPKGWTWAQGTHQYTITVDCSGSARDETATREFQVSEGVRLLDSAVYLRLGGIYDVKLGNIAAPITTVHPLQPMVALVNIIHMTELEAKRAVQGDCRGTISWDSQVAQALIPGTPHQTVEDVTLP